MSSIFDLCLDCAEKFEQRFKDTGELVRITVDESLGLRDVVYTSDRYRRAHISIIDGRQTKKIWMLHVTIFPQTNDNSPIYGFDIVAGANKVSGAFHDFSKAGDRNHAMMKWFAEWTADLEWNKRRELPDWAKQIFSDNMVAIGAVDAEELGYFIDLGLTTLNYYLGRVGNTQESGADYHMAQNLYCHYQRQNPHTPRALEKLGFTSETARKFIDENVFPQIG